jgi:hypothetical protein
VVDPDRISVQMLQIAPDPAADLKRMAGLQLAKIPAVGSLNV